MNTKELAASIIAIMMVAAIFVTTAAAFTAPNANDDRVEFEYGVGDCDGLYVNSRENCTYPYDGPDMTTLRIYGEGSYDAAFPYTDPEAPFDPTKDEAPEKDFVVFNPAYMEEHFLGDSILVDSQDAEEKVFVRQWYVPRYPEPIGDVWGDQPTVSSADIVTEYSYMLLDQDTHKPVAGHAAAGTCFWFPIGSRGGQIGLDSFDLTTGRWDVGDPTIVTLTEIDDYNEDDMKDITIATRDTIRLWESRQWVEFLDHRIYVREIAQGPGDTWFAIVDVYYIGNDGEELIEMNVGIEVGAGPVAFGRHVHPDKTLTFTRPWYIEALYHTEGGGRDSVYVKLGRRLHMGETFFVDGAEYDISMIYGPNEDDFKYITIRNPLPKCTEGQDEIDLNVLSITKECVSSCAVMPMLPPFNWDHVVVDDIHCCVDDDCDDELKCDQFSNDESDLTERLVDVPALEIMWLFEETETRFYTNLLEILKEGTPEKWQWICINILPNQYTEMYYPPMDDSDNCCNYEGDYLLVSSWEAPNSCGDRMKFAHDAIDSSDIYVNEQADDGTGEDACGTNSVRIYGEEDMDAAFPYTDPEGPFNKLSADAPRKDFVTFNPAHMEEHYLDDSILVNSQDANEKVFVRQWYVPEYPEPRGDVWGDQPTVSSADIVTEYSYMLLDTDNMPAAGRAAAGTCFWFPIGSRGGQIGLDSFDLTTGPWNVGDPTIVTLTEIDDYNEDDMKDITIATRNPVRLWESRQWVEFIDHRIYVREIAQGPGDTWFAIVDVYYIGNDNQELIEMNVGVEVGAGPVAFGRHVHPDKTLTFTRPWYIEALYHTQGIGQDSVYVNLGRRLHMGETFFVDGAEYDISMIYGPNEDDFKYITIRNPLPKCIPDVQGDIDLDVLSITKECVRSCCDVMPMLPPFNMVHDIVDDIGIPIDCSCPPGDSIRDEPECIDDCADTVAERIVEGEAPFVSYWYDEAIEARFRTNLLEILDEDTPESWDMLCMWTLPDAYTAMVYPQVGDCDCCGNEDADFLVTTSGPKGLVQQLLCGDVDGSGSVNTLDVTKLFDFVTHGSPSIDELAADVDNSGSINTLDVTKLFDFVTHGSPPLNCA